MRVESSVVATIVGPPNLVACHADGLGDDWRDDCSSREKPVKNNAIRFRQRQAVEEREDRAVVKGEGCGFKRHSRLCDWTMGLLSQPPVLFGGLEPYPDNWRASVRRPATLPHFPMVLHRGGYPDGS